ncbi:MULTISPECIES: hypothetical protein [unclassified Nocardiopsis]|uniref:hypothetical protein n=1 Tax=Nocardiopsis TaxID=2013 RepID=UPI00387B8922
MTQDPLPSQPSFPSHPSKRPLSNGAKVALGLGIGFLLTTLLGTVGVIGTVLTLRHLAPEPSPTAVVEEAADGYTAATLVDELDTLYPLPDPRDETPSCEPEGCLGAVETDLLTVYELPDTTSATAWAATLGPGDARPAGRFVLFWPETSPQPLQDRDKLHTKAIVLVG